MPLPEGPASARDLHRNPCLFGILSDNRVPRLGGIRLSKRPIWMLWRRGARCFPTPIAPARSACRRARLLPPDNIRIRPAIIAMRRPGMFFAIIRLNWNAIGVQKQGAGAKALGRAALQDFK